MKCSLDLLLRHLAALVTCMTVASCNADDPDVRPHRFENVVLVVIDTLRADHLGSYGHTRVTSPRIDELARQSATFARALAPSPWTAPSMGSLLTGRLPSRHGAGEVKRDSEGRIVLVRGKKVFAKPDESVPMLAELLAGAGYRTAAVSTNPALAPGSGFERGFEHYEFLGKLMTGAAVTEAALEKVDAYGGEPLFIYVHYFDPHLPYHATGDFAGRFTTGIDAELGRGVWNPQSVRKRIDQFTHDDRAYLDAAYDEEIALVDAAVGDLVEGLRARNELDESLLIVTSDHGEELFEHGGFEHGHALWQELLHVPLLLHAPGRVTPGRIGRPVSLIDVFETILDMTGIEHGDDGGGRSLAPLVESAPRPDSQDTPIVDRRPHVIESMLYGPDQAALIEWPWKLIVGPGDRRLLFDLETDPSEEQPSPLEGDLAVRARSMESRLDAIRDAERAERPARVDWELDEETRLQLGGLGYLEDS